MRKKLSKLFTVIGFLFFFMFVYVAFTGYADTLVYAMVHYQPMLVVILGTFFLILGRIFNKKSKSE
ncbi:MAG: hypothetical protein E7510_10475 [Ruminococcus sp.]|nr:hypothetical protein [Ruminococcus sp.]